MIILSSDYDGTLKTRIHDLYINIQEIRKFRMMGNIFVLNTGRHFTSIYAEIQKYNIPFDYLCCNDGSVTFNEDLDVISEKKLVPSQIKRIKDLMAYFPNFHFERHYTATGIFKSEVEGPIEVQIVKPKLEKFSELIKLINPQEMGLEYFTWKNSLFLKNNSNKGDALDDIVASITPPINPKNIYAVGDQENDLKMITEHHGFRMLESSPKLWFSTWRVVPEVHCLVKHLNRKSKRNQNIKQF